LSSPNITLPIVPSKVDPAEMQHNRVIQLVRKYRPYQGWSTFAILLVMLWVLAESVQSARWTESLNLPEVVFWAALAGLVISKVRLHFVFLHPLGIALGALIVVWKSSVLVDDSVNGWARFTEMWSRLEVWYGAATNDGLSTDLLPFAIGLLALAWMIGYFGSWFVFRSSNPWIAVVFAGVAILTNLSFLPPGLAPIFFLFILFAMLLIVRLTVVQRQREWDRSGIRFEMMSGWLTMHSTFWFGLLVVIIAGMMPLKVYVSENMAEVWRQARTPIESLEEDFARLFAGVPTQKQVDGRFFGKNLPFIGAISFGGEVVFWADTEYPSYWTSQTYSEYTSLGWIAGDTNKVKVGPDTLSPPRSDSRERISVEQSLQVSFRTSDFLAGGSLDWLSHDAVLGALDPKAFDIDLLDDALDSTLPPDVQQMAATIREDLDMVPDTFVDTYVSRFLLPDLVLNEIQYGTDPVTEEEFLKGITVQRKAAVASEIVSWRFSKRLQANEPYSMVSYVSLASDEELRRSNTNYKHFITDHYLQLPASLPQRVRDKAIELTADAENPFDKAVLIQRYLRSDEFTYDQENVVAPPRGSDGVDFFIFETQLGYSDYFASAMTVMMRAVGVPARLAAGYAPGVYDDKLDRRVIRDFDSHGWVQVYFPQYGWIDFEPTPRWEEHERNLITGPGSDLIGDRGFTVFAGDESDYVDPADEEGLADELGGSGRFDLRTLLPFDLIVVLQRSAMAAGSILVLWLLLFIAWTWNLRGLTSVEKAYARMGRLGAIAGVGRRFDQTALDYAGQLSMANERLSEPALRIAWAYSGIRYAPSDAAPEKGNSESGSPDVEQGNHDADWRIIRGPLLSMALRRLIPGGQRTG